MAQEKSITQETLHLKHNERSGDSVKMTSSLSYAALASHNWQLLSILMRVGAFLHLVV